MLTEESIVVDTIANTNEQVMRMEAITPAKRDAYALIREYGRGNADACADILEGLKTDAEATAVINALVEAGAILAEQLARKTGNDPEDEIRSVIADFGTPSKDGAKVLDYIERVTTGAKGTTVLPPHWDNETAQAHADQAILQGIIEIDTTLGKQFVGGSDEAFDKMMEKLQLLLANE